MHLDIEDDAGFEAICQQGRELGFDGKSLIHPKQIGPANTVFGPNEWEIDHAKAVITAWNDATAQGKAVAVLNGKLIEILHMEEAQRTLAIGKSINARSLTG